jgi:hypothetical protein
MPDTLEGHEETRTASEENNPGEGWFTLILCRISANFIKLAAFVWSSQLVSSEKCEYTFP